MKLAGLFLLALYATVCPSRAALRPERYVLILEDKPLASDAVSRNEVIRSARRAPLLAKQEVLTAAVKERGFRVTATDQNLVNAVFVEAPAGALEELRSLPGVAYVEKLLPIQRHLANALNLMNVPAAWSAVNGSQNAGAGVKIAVLDTGIDITHPAFQEGTLQYPAGFPKCREDRGDCGFVNRKVIAARSYVDLLVGKDPATSRPDDLSPRDRVGHGTAVAMIAGGLTNTGPAGAITGVAPGAWLGNYKIFGSPGVNGQFTFEDVLFEAIRDAASDGMDIAVLSLGAPALWGPRDSGSTCGKSGTVSCDWRAEAVENASRMGLTLVVSAGNDGDFGSAYPAFNSIQSPGTAPAAITVGASTNSHIYYQSLRIDGPNTPADLRRINTFLSDGPPPSPGFSATIRDVTATGDDGLACSPMANGSLSGAVALILRGGCQFAIKINNAQNAGAVGVILYQPENVNLPVPIEGAAATGIPAVLIGNRNGVALKAYVAQTAEARAAFDPALTSVSTTEFDTMAFFSSRGPSIRENAIKPELVAVGTDIYTATQKYDPNGDLYDASGYAAVQGTSFAAPLVAGAVAMVKQRNPSMTPARLKSAVVNTANPRIIDYDGNRQITAGVLDTGGGKLDANAAVRTTVTVEPSTLSFGVLASQLPTAAQTLTLCNFATSSVTLRLTVAPFTGQNASAGLSLSGNSLSLGAATAAGPACSQSITVRVTGNRPGPGVYEGDIEVTGGAVPLHVPYVFLVGDGAPVSLLSLQGRDFEGEPSQTIPLTFKLVDRFGVPIAGQNVRFQTSVGDGSIREEGRTTDELGIGFADVVLGNQLGEQEFYAAVGNATNFGIFFNGRVRPRPAINSGGVVDAISQQARPGYAPGSYISIYGRGLSEATRVYSTPYLPLSLAGVSVGFDVPSQNLSVPGRLHFVREDQINVLIPWELQGVASVQMKVSIGDSSSSVVTVPIAAQSPSLFEGADASGRVFVRAVGENGVIDSATPARKNGLVSLYVNGLGAVDNQPPTGEPGPSSPLAATRVAPTVTIAGRPVEVLFSGLAPGFVGLYQVNVRIAADAPSGVQPVVISTNGVASKPVNIPVE